MEATVFTEPFFLFFAEAFGVSDSPTGYFLDSGQAGILGTIDGLAATVASAGAAVGETTIAAHCGHLLFLLNFFAAVERGEMIEPDWQSSWTTKAVDEAAWRELRAALRSAYNDLVERLRARELEEAA